MSDGVMSDEELRHHLDECLNGAADPAATLAAAPDADLARLADGLYRHLDTPSPAFGARFWYVRVTEELRLRRLGVSRLDPAAPEDAVDSPVASEVPAG
ncbi:hypothetical protein [Arthrobacter sp. NPDC057013]|uniref:hypothetical protein n=1 Tax=Arthrobacter sp. NPDC057013 TaxID=3345999 RepID=UPI00363251AD